MSQAVKKPLTVLQKSINKHVTIRLKNDVEYHGRMNNIDPYMNMILTDASEYSSGSAVANFGKIVIRGNNVLFVKIEDAI